jgi:CTP synthase (UTP-ammonia lyase)
MFPVRGTDFRENHMEANRAVKYILVSGGVLSGIGKGVVASSTAMLLRSYGLRVTNIKIDPYLNIGIL